MAPPINPDPWIPASRDGVAPRWGACAVTVYRVNTIGALFHPVVSSLTPLPNVECLGVQLNEGPDPGSAALRYRFDGTDPQAPQSAEQALSTSSTTDTLPRLVEVGDRLAVRVTRWDGVNFWLFDGFPLEWGVTLDRDTELVMMSATGVAKRLWDTPAGGAVWRESDEPEAVNDVPTALVAQANPRGAPNASPGTADSGTDPFTYPVFMDPSVTGTDTDGNDYPRVWTLPMLVAHLAYTCNKDQGYVKNPERRLLDRVLTGREPIEGTPFDPTDPATYTAKDLAAADAPLTGKAWPVLAHDQVKDYGFGMAFRLDADGSGNPTTALELFTKQATAVKSVYLASRVSPLDAGANNIAGARLARDLSGVVNSWVVDGAPDRYEVSFVLMPGFPSRASDGTGANLKTFRSNALTSDTYDSYRAFLLDEDGRGYYENGSLVKVQAGATSLDSVFGAPDADTSTPTYVARRRAPVGELFTTETNGKPRKATLSVSTDFNNGGFPDVWDGTGHWQEVHGGWELLKDRVGVRVNVSDPNAWNIGPSDDAGVPFKDGKVNLVELVAAGKPLTLRLTCVVEADQALRATAAPRAASPIPNTVERRIDARDRYARHTIKGGSEFNDGTSAKDVKARDDYDLAFAEATAARTATEAGVFEGEIEIPYLTMYYRIGDRIDRVRGRDLGLRTDVPGPYAPVLPMVVGVRWNLDGRQSTTLTLSDAGLDRRRYARPRPARKGRRSDGGDGARELAALAASVQAAGFGVATGRL